MVHEMQRQKYGSRYSQVYLERNPDFGLLAAAFGIGYRKIIANADVEPALREMLAAEGPFLLECRVDPHEPTLYGHIE